ncbi:hypothetical protein LJC48_05130 [Desulfovibrio sp. OttesenSCG-928-C06]|nr:hypothetical protein [Desulfovibrio sp. OttesenSCG-928-C06]
MKDYNMILKKVVKQILPYGIVKLYSSHRQTEYYKSLAPSAFWIQPHAEHEECVIIASGPSAVQNRQMIQAYSQKADFFSVNRSLTAHWVSELQPKIHVIQDPVYFGKTKHFHTPAFVKNIISDTQNMLSKITWGLKLYVPEYAYKKATELYGTKNISLVAFPIAPPPENLERTTKFQLMDSGLYNCGSYNVVLGALYLAMIAGYKTIWLVGVDASTMLSINVDQHCRTFTKIMHFHDDAGEKDFLDMDMETFLRNSYIAAKEFNFASEYASYKGIRVINTSLDSLRDSFPKGCLGEEPYEFLRKTNE